MALKKKMLKSKEEQLYMLEVFVDQLNLNPDRTSDANNDKVIVCVTFADLVPYEITTQHKDRADSKENREDAQDMIDFKCGKSCLFAKTPNNLLKAMRSTPLTTEVYTEESVCSVKSKRVLCTAKVRLSACMCAQVIAARNEIDGLPTPCVVKNTFDLTDSEDKVSGTISIILRLSCFGSSIVKHFSLDEKSFILQDSPFREKFLCPNFTPDSAKNQQNLRDTKSLLKRPDSPPRISIDDPGFEDLTTAEKLNDPKYRELIYRTYPNEPTCRCLPTNRSTHPLMCRSGCSRPCCMKLRNPKLLLTKDKRNVKNHPPNTYCTNRIQSTLPGIKPDTSCCNVTRLRGGGDIEQIYLGPTEYAWTDYDTDYAWYDDRNIETRLEGGGGEKSSCSCGGGALPVQFRRTLSREGGANVGVQDACKPGYRTDGPKPGCVCPGKETSSWKRGSAKCTKKPCLGVDCLIRAFKEAQDFVDSIGRVPGLAGLGLMDPSESPFFGRDIDKDYVPAEGPAEKRRGQSAPSQPVALNAQCNAPCNAQIGRPMVPGDGVPVPYAAPTPLTIAVPGRTGIVREAIPTLPISSSVTVSMKQKKKEEKKEEKIEKQKELDATASVPLDGEGGPCGEPKCKSRRKKPVESTSLSTTPSNPSHRADPARREEVTESPFKKPGVQREVKPPNINTLPHVRNDIRNDVRNHSRGSEKGKHKAKPNTVGPGGDRNAVGKTSIRVSRRTMRYVYSIGDAYPGIVYGHKNCIDPRMRVPANMGWLWNTMNTAGNLKPRIGWKPGAIGRYLNEMLKEAKAGSILEQANRPRSVPSRVKKARVFKSMSYSSVKKMQTKMEGEDEVEAPPTLHIHRKDGTYYVTMYPIKAETTDVPRLNEPMKPLQFKIVKNKDDASVASSSTASDMEIEFSPPAAVTRYRRKPDVIHVDTQVRQQEILDATKPADSLKKKEKKTKKEKKGKK